MNARNLVWSAKKRDIEPLDDGDLYLFETNLKIRKSFHDVAAHVPSKSFKDLVHYYYTWKKTPRYTLWKRRRAGHGLPTIFVVSDSLTGGMLPAREVAPVVYDAQSGARKSTRLKSSH